MKAFCIPLVLMILQSCDIPQDPENSWHDAKNEQLLVGIVHNPPFTEWKDNNYLGSEVSMVKKFARENELQIKWISASESTLIEMTKKYQLHLIIGGFDKNTVWANKVGTTRPYDKTHVWLVARGENKLIENVEKYFLKNEEIQ